MGNTRDSINELLEQIKSQGYHYILAIFEEDPENKTKDSINLYSSFETGHLKKLADVILALEKKEPKPEVKSEKKEKKRK